MLVANPIPFQTDCWRPQTLRETVLVTRPAYGFDIIPQLAGRIGRRKVRKAPDGYTLPVSILVPSPGRSFLRLVGIRSEYAAARTAECQ